MVQNMPEPSILVEWCQCKQWFLSPLVQSDGLDSTCGLYWTVAEVYYLPLISANCMYSIYMVGTESSDVGVSNSQTYIGLPRHKYAVL